MIVNPFIMGIMTTLLFEVAVIIGVIIYACNKK